MTDPAMIEILLRRLPGMMVSLCRPTIKISCAVFGVGWIVFLAYF
jgi:hypothetical protein